MKKDYQSLELNITLFDEKSVLDDGVSGWWGAFDDFDDLMKAIAIGETYEE